MTSFGKFDTREFDNFVAEFENKANGEVIVREVEQVMTKTAGVALNKVKRKTPVDYGTLRRNWKAGNIKRSGKSMSVEISNNTEHAPYIENGHRIVRGGKTVGFQKGHFMLKTTVDEVNDSWGRTLGKSLDDTLRELLGG